MGFENISFISEENLKLIIKILISLALGILIGLERERKAKTEAFIGIRTIPLISILGTVSAFIYSHYWHGIFWFTFGALIIYTSINYYKEYEKDVGITTEVSSLIAFIIGILVYYEYIYSAIFITFITTTLLAAKPFLEKFAKNISQEELISILKFILITVIIYPLLPDKDFGPFNAFNLKSIWKVVVIVSSIDFIGYIFMKWKGGGALWLTGLIGGLASSTAVSYDFAKKVREYPQLEKTAALGIIAAWSVMNIRVIVLAGVISIELAKAVSVPLLLTTVIYLVFILIYYKDVFKTSSTTTQINVKNPFNLSSALQFAFIYAMVKLLIKALEFYMGDKGIYIASFISGVIDVDAITLSLATLVKNNPSMLEVAKKGLLIAVISNSYFKFLYVFAFGNKQLAKRIAVFLFIITVVCSIFIVL